jgi:opacity protein-like surface antigen
MTMKNAAGRATAMAILALAATTASAVDNIWNGTYAGFNAGQASSHTCNTWAASGSSAESATLAGFSQPGCASHGAFLGGGQIGDNFQSQRLSWGVEADVDFWEGGSSSAQTANFDPSPAPPGGPPAGTYVFSGRQTPDFLGMFTARIGYSGNQWMPYLKGGALLAGGSQTSTLSYIPDGATKATASFNGGKSFASIGWVAGGGAEFGLYGPWSISAEYLHASLGKGSSSTAGCAGIAANCAAFANASLQDTHGSFEANLIRISINYWFDYW